MIQHSSNYHRLFAEAVVLLSALAYMIAHHFEGYLSLFRRGHEMIDTKAIHKSDKRKYARVQMRSKIALHILHLKVHAAHKRNKNL